MDLANFTATVEKLRHDTTEVDWQLAEEEAKARDLQLSAFKSARRREEVEKEIHVLTGQICELEMEAEDLACLHTQGFVDGPSQERVTHSEDRHAMQAGRSTRSCVIAGTSWHILDDSSYFHDMQLGTMHALAMFLCMSLTFCVHVLSRDMADHFSSEVILFHVHRCSSKASGVQLMRHAMSSWLHVPASRRGAAPCTRAWPLTRLRKSPLKYLQGCVRPR